MAGHAQLGEIGDVAPPVEDAKHHTLAVDRGYRRDAQVDFTLGKTQPNPSILWQSPLRDVQVCHYLDAADRGGLVYAGRPGDVVEHPVDSVTDAEPVRRGL